MHYPAVAAIGEFSHCQVQWTASEANMNDTNSKSPLERRSFIGRFWAGFTALGASAAFSTVAGAQSAAKNWKPVRHEIDDWFDEGGSKHRLIFDTTAPDGFGQSLAFANNFFTANQEAYGVKESDISVIIVVRHRSTAFGYNDAIWAKYGTLLAERMNKLEDPKTKKAPIVNIYANSPGPELPSMGTSLDAVLKRGVRFGVCRMATRGLAGSLAKSTGETADKVFDELSANLIGNARLVPAGIVAVSRAQEHGYTFVSA